MFTLSKAEWDKLKEVYSVPAIGLTDPFVYTHENMNKYVADIIAPDLLHPAEDNLVVAHSTLGVSIFDRNLIALGKLFVSSLKP
jgi:hypothetical protein